MVLWPQFNKSLHLLITPHLPSGQWLCHLSVWFSCSLCWIVYLYSHYKRSGPGFTCKWIETPFFSKTILSEPNCFREWAPLNWNYSPKCTAGVNLVSSFFLPCYTDLNISPKCSTFASLEIFGFFQLFFYCVLPTIQHLSVSGWMNNSIQRHCYAECRVKSRMGKGRRWCRRKMREKLCMLHTSQVWIFNH